jgi:NADH:ubiquinone oxidoreductase subunit B-like Fe-S oxidoreductase
MKTNIIKLPSKWGDVPATSGGMLYESSCDSIVGADHKNIPLDFYCPKYTFTSEAGE